MRLFTYLAVFSCSVALVASQGPPSETCGYWVLDPVHPGVMTGACKDTAGHNHHNIVKLSDCLRNDNGQLECLKGGNATNSCTFRDLKSNGAAISSNCTTSSGSFLSTVNFPLNSCLRNCEGTICC